MKEILLKKISEMSDLINSLSEEDGELKETIEEGNLSDLIVNNDCDADNEGVIKTGFNSIDESMQGFLPGEISVVGGRPAMGKTGLLLSMALNISNNKIPLLYINLESSVNQITKRIRENHIEDNADIDISNFYLMSLSGNIDVIVEKIKEYIKTRSVKIIFIDYIQLISIFNNKSYRDLELTVVIRKLKQLAIQNNISIVIASQLNRGVEYRAGDKKPMLSDMRDSGSIEQESDKILFIYRPEYYGFTENIDGNCTKGLAEIIIAKNRNGKTGTAVISYKGTAVAFFNNKNNNAVFGDLNTDIIFN